MHKQKEKIFEDWRDSLGYDEQTLHDYLDTIKAYIDFAEHYSSLSMSNVVEQSEETNTLHIGSVSVSNFIDQSKSLLIGYQAYYLDGSNKFYKEHSDIHKGTVINPLVDIKQVGRVC